MVGKVLNVRYQLEQLVGSGGMADVYRAYDNLLGRSVAVKILHPQYSRDPVFIQRFRQEAQAAANLNQPNIVNVYDWGIEDSFYYIVMEYVEGRDLKDIILQGGPLLPERAVEIGVAICAALEAAHAQGIVHRDIKPQNIIVTGDKQIKVMDFGIARAAGGSAMTQTGTIMGTPQYISPEQAQGRPADPRSDLYSLGVVVYEMLTGKAPFDGENPVSIAYKHVREDPLPPSMVNPDISPGLEAVVMKALAKNPENRYQNAMEMQADLERCLEGAPVYATPVLSAEEAARGATMVYPAGRAGGRGKSRTWIWIVVILLILAAGGVGAWAIVRTTGGVKVPPLVDKTESQASQALEGLGLKLRVEKRVRDAGKPKGTIISQDPSAGSKVSKGGTVEVVVSEGAELVSTPDCRGLAQGAAEQALQEAGLEVGSVSQEFSATAKEGLVASQSPEPGARVAKGTTVNLAISKGQETVLVPSVIGMTKDAALQQLQSAGLQGETQEEASSLQPTGSVFEQNPAAGAKAPKGSKVIIKVATLPVKVSVPPLTGLDQATAENKIVAAGLKPYVVDQQTLVKAKVGTVLKQDPASGMQVDKGSTVKIYVGVAPPTTAPAP